MKEIYSNMTKELLIERLQIQEMGIINLDRVIEEIDNSTQQYKGEREGLVILKIECMDHIKIIKEMLVELDGGFNVNNKQNLSDLNFNLERLIKEKQYIQQNLNKNWLETELKLNPYLQQSQKDVMLFKERVFKDKYNSELKEINELISRIKARILELEYQLEDNKQNTYSNPLCEFKKVDDKYSGTVCFEIGLKVFDDIENIECYLKTNKNKVIEMYGKHYIPDMFGNSFNITQGQLEYAKSL